MIILPCGVAVIEGDTHISAWVANQKKLTIAEKYLAPFRTFVPVGGTVVDAGAMIGDHTATYAEWVGSHGRVHAFEPNPEAFECLTYNMRSLPHVQLHQFGLSDHAGTCTLNLSPNAGESYLQNHAGAVRTLTLDSLSLREIDFLKIDVEGFETWLIKGAHETIAHCRPVMLVEVNDNALRRASSSRDELLEMLASLQYCVTLTDPRLRWDDPQYDVICIPIS